MALISITRLRVRSLRFMPAFIYLSLKSAHQAKKANGNLGMKLLRDANRAFWTCTAWQDEASMRAYMMSPPHRAAMSKLPGWCDEASLVHWNQQESTLPDWPE